MCVQSATDSILASKFTISPGCEEDLTAHAEGLAANAAWVLAKAEAEVELGEELPLDGLDLGTGEAEESVEADEDKAGQAAGSEAHADDFAGEEGQEAAGGDEAAESDELTRRSLEIGGSG